jgi:hypothetical protein
MAATEDREVVTATPAATEDRKTVTATPAATEDPKTVTATPATAGPAIARVGVAETGATAADDETSN